MHNLGWEVAGNDTFIGGEEDNVPNFVDFTLCDCSDFDSMQKGYERMFNSLSLSRNCP